MALPLAATDLPVSSDGDPGVKVLAIAEVTNVNALAPGARLDFAAAGLTIVYGDNGSGKSGYVRVLKRVCRARATPERIFPNLLHQDSRSTSAVIEYAVGDDARSLTWEPAMPATDELGAVSVFDRSCGVAYVQAENDVAYRPLGLDLLDALGDCLQAVRRRITAERATLVTSLSPPPPDLVGTPSLSEIWPVSVRHTMSALARVPTWTADDALDLEQVSRALAVPSPKETATGLRAQRTIVMRTQRRLAEIEATVGDAAVADLRHARSDEVDAEAALARIRIDALGTEPLSGVGGALWRAMWAAAAEYSTAEAHPGHDFPHTGPGATCVLCGQELSDAAGKRFARLRALVETELSETAEQARLRLSTSRTKLETLSSGTSDDELVTSLAEVDPASRASFEAFVAAAKARATELVRWLGAGDDPMLAPLPTGLSDAMDASSESLADEIDRLEQAADPVAAEGLRSEARDLEARRWASDNKAMISDEIHRLQKVAAMDAAITACDTISVTRESNTLTARYVTAQLERNLVDELQRLNPSRIGIRLAERGERGATYHRLELDSPSPTNARVHDVVSDGEFGALALASFFAELAESPGHSAIVLDDPVSSLDHVYRQRVAQRLVEEAAHRQVVVFTHDLVFLHDLQTAAESRDVPVTYRRLSLTATHVGVPVAEPPWFGMKVGQRIEHLQAELSTLRATFVDGDFEGYQDRARGWYRRLRETWERAVEEVLFGDVVMRYRHAVHTQTLLTSSVWVFDEEDVKELDQAMTKSSAWLHDQPMAVNQPVPEPDELAADLSVLRDWVQRIKAKRKSGRTPVARG